MNITLNGSSVDFKDGIWIKEKLSEDLDEGLMLLPQSDILAVEPLDQVVITHTDFTKNMLVSNIKRVTSKFTTPKEYNYFLWLTSPTIQLQRIVLPNRSVTQPVIGSKTSIYTIMSRYVSMYSDYTISTALQTLTTDEDCAEFQWNKPTLFEVLNDLLSPLNVVVTMTEFDEITYLDLNADGDTIVTTYINDEEQEQLLQDYASKVDSDIENTVYSKENTHTIQWIVPKTDEDAIVTTDNFKLILDKPVYKINKIIAKVQPDSTAYVYEADLTDYIVEKTAYDLLEPSNSTTTPITGDVKRNAFYFTVGSNIIDGLSYTEDNFLGITSNYAINNVFYNAYYAENGSYPTIGKTNVLRYAFKVDYIAQETVRIVSNKEDSIKNSSVLINNQETSYVNYDSFSKKQQLTANRLGNPNLIIKGRFYNWSDVPSLGDLYDTTYKLAEREYTINESNFTFKGICSDNYVLKSLFTGLKQERRFTSIASDSEAFECNHVTEYTFNLSNTADSTDSTFESYMMGFGQADENINLVYFAPNVTTDKYGIAPSVYNSDKSITMTYKMYDNYNVGVSSNTSTLIFNIDQIGLKNVPYVDSNGQYTYHEFRLYKTIESLIDSTDSANVSLGLQTAREYPLLETALLSSSDLVFTSTFNYRYKDNREITVETLQFNFTSDSNIGFTSKFLANNNMLYTGDSDVTYYVAYSETETYSKGDTTYKGSIDDGTYFTLTQTNSYFNLTANSTIAVDDLASWAIVDSSGNIYIYNNGNNSFINLNLE